MSDRVQFGQLVLGEVFSAIPLNEQEDTNWDDVPQDIKDTFETLGIFEAEKKFLAGMQVQPSKNYPYGLNQQDPFMKIEIGGYRSREVTERDLYPDNAVNLNTGKTIRISDKDLVVYEGQNPWMMNSMNKETIVE